MTIPIIDPFDILGDRTLNFLESALNPEQVQHQFQTQLHHWLGIRKQLNLNAIRVVRHKPRRRCLIEYDVIIEDDGAIESMTWIGKVRSKGLDQTSYQLQHSLWTHGFHDTSSDGVSVPEPIGIIPEWQMWLQKKVPGVTTTPLIPQPGGMELCQHIAVALHKLHTASVTPSRSHSIADELTILHDRLSRVAQEFPQWQTRLERVLIQCERLAKTISFPQIRGIHRDFYSDQIIVNGSRLYLLDFDLMAIGDAGLDIGNFNGHLLEQSLRTLGNANALIQHQHILTKCFANLAEEAVRPSIHISAEIYTILTLARHIFISTQFADRRTFTKPILELCEQKLEQLMKQSKSIFINRKLLIS